MDQTRREIDFSIFLVHRVAERWMKTPAETFRMLNEAGIVSDYIVPFYDVLHTLGEECLVEDLTNLARKRGVAV